MFSRFDDSDFLGDIVRRAVKIRLTEWFPEHSDLIGTGFGYMEVSQSTYRSVRRAAPFGEDEHVDGQFRVLSVEAMVHGQAVNLDFLAISKKWKARSADSVIRAIRLIDKGEPLFYEGRGRRLIDPIELLEARAIASVQGIALDPVQPDPRVPAPV